MEKSKKIYSISIAPEVMKMADDLAKKNFVNRSSYLQSLIISAHTDSLNKKDK